MASVLMTMVFSIILTSNFTFTCKQVRNTKQTNKLDNCFQRTQDFLMKVDSEAGQIDSTIFFNIHISS